MLFLTQLEVLTLIIHGDHARGFTPIDNRFLRDKRLTLKAKGLLALMLSLPDDWKFSAEGLAAILREKRDAVTTALQELEACGYLTRCPQTRDDHGQLRANNWIIREVSASTQSPLLDIPPADNSAANNPVTDNAAQPNTELTKKEEEKKDEERLSPSADKLPDSVSASEVQTIIAALAENDIVATRADIVALYQDVGLDRLLASISYAVDGGATHWGYISRVAKTGGPRRKTGQSSHRKHSQAQREKAEAYSALDIIALQETWQREAAENKVD